MRSIFAVLALVALTACSGVADGPDEFGVVPSKPLEQPANYIDLPDPIPGAANRTDVTPTSDAVAALGGRVTAGGIPASDSGIVTFASRYGVDPSIRTELFREDEAYFDRRTRFGGLRGRSNRYFRVYAPQTLDAYEEVDRFRAAGVRVPTSPPER